MPRLMDPGSGAVVSVGADAAASLLGMGWTVAPEGAPSGNASRDEWEAYALANGRTEEDVAELSRNEIRDLFA